jgi:hypothetical protein
MSDITEDVWNNIYEHFDSQEILDAVGHIDTARAYLADTEINKPPEIRNELIDMHSVAMDIVRYGSRNKEKVADFFDTAYGLSDEITDLMEELEKVQNISTNLLEQYPESLNS